MNTRHTSRLVAAGLLVAAAMAGPAGAHTILDTKGDTTYERVYFGYAGRARESLSDILAGYTDAITGLPSPITNTGGEPIPEPATIALIGAGLGLTAIWRRRR